MNLYTVSPAYHEHGNIQYLKHPLHLGGKINMTGGVNQRYKHIVKMDARLFGKNSYAAFTLHIIGVKKGIPVIDPAKRPYLPGLKKKRLGESCLARVYMSKHSCYYFLHANLFLRIFCNYSASQVLGAE